MRKFGLNKQIMTKSDENQLSSRQFMALPFFLTSSSIEAACRDANISKDTYYEWMKQDIFKAKLERMRNEIVSDAINQLKNNTTKAASTLTALLDKGDSPAIQRAAANDILNHVMKFMELKEIEERLINLEKQVMKNK